MGMRSAFAATLAASVLAVAPSASASLITLSGSLDASQVVEPVLDASGNVVGSAPAGVISNAIGFATVVFDTVALTITTDFSWSGLTGNADRMHLHDAPAGSSRLEPPYDRFFHELIQGQIHVLPTNIDPGLVPCGGDPTELGWDSTADCAPASGSLHDVLSLDPAVNPNAYVYFAPNGAGGVPGFPDFAALVADAVANGLFLDVHTELYPGGEIRGQLLYQTVSEPSMLALCALLLLALAAGRRRRSTRR